MGKSRNSRYYHDDADDHDTRIENEKRLEQRRKGKKDKQSRRFENLPDNGTFVNDDDEWLNDNPVGKEII